jgi:hypothetical protein
LIAVARLDKSYFPSHDAGSEENVDSQLLTLGSYRVREGGIEFHSEKEVGLYTEMHLQVLGSEASEPIRFNGVVVGCTGNKHQGYQVSLAYTNITKEAQLSLFEMYWAHM